MLASHSSTVRKRVQSFNGPRSPLNTVTKDFNFQLGSSPSTLTTPTLLSTPTTTTTAAFSVPKFEPVPQNDEVNEKLGVLTHGEAVPCLPYAGEQLSGLENAPLPFTR